MTQVETIKVLAVLKAAYPRFYADISRETVEQTVALWAEMFEDDAVEEVMAAVKAFIAGDSKGFPPVIGVIKEQLRLLREGENTDDSELEAWNQVRKAVSNGYYGAYKEFEKLPPLVQQIVGEPNTLREWAVMDSEQFETVVASNFMRSYRAKKEHEKEWGKLPESVKLMYGSGSPFLRIQKGYEEELLLESPGEGFDNPPPENVTYTYPDSDFFAEIRKNIQRAQARREAK